MKGFADDNFKFEENGRKLSKQVENTVGEAEIARYEQFLLFPQCFQKACFPGASKGVIGWEWVNCESIENLAGRKKKLVSIQRDFSSLSIQMANFDLDMIENIVGKEENAGCQHFLSFPTMFSTGSFLVRVIKSGVFVNGLTHCHTIIPHFDTLKIYSCRKHSEKRRNRL